jgi:hypothetical protein
MVHFVFKYVNQISIFRHLNFKIKTFFQQGAARIEEQEVIARESNGEECDMTLKNNIEGIIIKWAYQIEEVKQCIKQTNETAYSRLSQTTSIE